MSVLLDALKKAAQQKQDASLSDKEEDESVGLPEPSDDLEGESQQQGDAEKNHKELKLSLALEDVAEDKASQGKDETSSSDVRTEVLLTTEDETFDKEGLDAVDEDADGGKRGISTPVDSDSDEGADYALREENAESSLIRENASKKGSSDQKPAEPEMNAHEGSRSDSDDEIITPFELEGPGGSAGPLPQTAAVTPGAAAVLAHQQCTLDEVSLSPGLGARIRQAIVFLLIPVAFALIIFYSATEWFGLLEKEFTRQVNLHRFNQVKYEYNRIARLDSQTSVSPALQDSSPDHRNGVVRDEGKNKGQRASSAAKQMGAAVQNLAALRRRQLARTGESQKKGRPVHQRTRRASKTESRHQHQVGASGRASGKGQVAQAILTPSYETRVEALIDSGQFERALKVLSEWQKHDATARPLYYRALVLARAGKVDAAMRVLKETLSQDPFSLESVELMCSLKPDCGMSVDGLKHYHQVFPASKMVAIALAQRLVDKGAVDSAIKVLSESFQLSPDADLAFNLAQLYLAHGDHVHAVQFVREAALLAKQQTPSFSEEQLSELISRVAQ